MKTKVIQTIKKYNMLSSGESVVLGLSGGKDSTALFYVLNDIKADFGITLQAVHINHNLRGEEAARDEAFVKDLCEKLGVSLTVFSFDVKAQAKKRGEGEEECGRKLRYEAFESIGADRIATAHTLSDVGETLLFNLTRGSGAKGLCSIPPVRDNIIRPLIECTSEEILDYLRANNVSYVEDSTNSNTDYSRNLLRHRVIPELKKINPDFESAVLKLTAVLRSETDYISLKAGELLKESSISNGVYSAELISAAHAAVKAECIKLILAKEGITPEYKHIKDIENILGSGGLTQISGGRFIRVRNGALDFPDFSVTPEYSFELSEGEFVLPKGILSVKKINCEQFENLKQSEFSFFIDCDKINGELICRNRRAGDSFYDGRRKLTKTMKDFLNENSIAPESRASYPVFELAGDVIGTVGASADKKYTADKTSKSIIFVHYEWR